jgi:hypothetical protein
MFLATATSRCQCGGERYASESDLSTLYCTAASARPEWDSRAAVIVLDVAEWQDHRNENSRSSTKLHSSLVGCCIGMGSSFDALPHDSPSSGSAWTCRSAFYFRQRMGIVARVGTRSIIHVVGQGDSDESLKQWVLLGTRVAQTSYCRRLQRLNSRETRLKFTPLRLWTVIRKEHGATASGRALARSFPRADIAGSAVTDQASLPWKCRLTL